MASSYEPRRQFHTLDGLRGAAAVIVVLWHGRDLFGPFIPKSGYLAVDLFFALSGFVICHAYGDRLGRSLSAVQFISMRLIRLYPLYLLGVALAAAYDIAGLAIGSPLSSPGWYLSSLVMSPAPPSDESQMLYPLNPPAWSLFFELASNLALALSPALARRRAALLPIIAVAAVALAIQAAAWGDLHGGSMWPTILGGLPRVTVSFTLGVLIYRWGPQLKLRVPSSVLIAVVVALLFAAPPQTLRPWYDVAVVTAAWPLILIAAINTEPARATEPLFHWLGMVSYAVYALHYPIIVATAGVVKRIDPWLLAHTPLAVGLACLALSLLAAWIADIVYDQPVRRYLTRWVYRHAFTPA